MSKKKNSRRKLPTEAYVIIHPVKVGDKSYNRGDKIMLTKEGAAYFKSIKKI